MQLTNSFVLEGLDSWMGWMFVLLLSIFHHFVDFWVYFEEIVFSAMDSF